MARQPSDITTAEYTIYANALDRLTPSYWTVGDGNWDGSKWVAVLHPMSGQWDIALTVSGGWADSIRPTFIRFVISSSLGNGKVTNRTATYTIVNIVNSGLYTLNWGGTTANDDFGGFNRTALGPFSISDITFIY